MKSIKKLLVATVAVAGLGLFVSCGSKGYSTEILKDPTVGTDIAGYCVAGPGAVGEAADAPKLDWSFKEAGKMEATSVKAISEVSTKVADQIAGKASFIYSLSHVQLGTKYVKAGWNTKVVEADGSVSARDGGYCAKVISYTHNPELEDPYKAATWFPSPEGHSVNLTKDALYMPPMSETKDAAGNDHAGNPAVYKAGWYTVVLVKFKDKVDGFSFGYGCILEKEATAEQAETDAMQVTDLTKLSLVGKINGVDDWNAGKTLTKGSDGKYTVTVELDVNDQIKVRANDAWAYSWGIGALTAGNTNFADADGNIKILTAGNYRVTIEVPAKLSAANNTATVFTVELVA